MSNSYDTSVLIQSGYDSLGKETQTRLIMAAQEASEESWHMIRILFSAIGDAAITRLIKYGQLPSTTPEDFNHLRVQIFGVTSMIRSLDKKFLELRDASIDSRREEEEPPFQDF